MIEVKPRSMLELLSKAKRDLPELLGDESHWQSVFIGGYPPPTVERLWRQWGSNRIYLHRIHPHDPKEVYLHPHPWPSAMSIVSGSYEMGLGFGSGESVPRIAATVILKEGDEYEMIDPDAWHYVRPLDKASVSLMVTGPRWSRSSLKVDTPFEPLSPIVMRALFEEFRARFQA